jgi:hypothetical protein
VLARICYIKEKGEREMSMRDDQMIKREREERLRDKVHMTFCARGWWS